MLTDQDIYLFREGTQEQLQAQFGCHWLGQGRGAQFAVWAPNAAAVSVIGEFNEWNGEANPLEARPDGSGVWSGSVAAAAHGQCYKYRIASRVGGYVVDKSDPVASLVARLRVARCRLDAGAHRA